jgi:MFS transporter, putative metabolite transport protein
MDEIATPELVRHSDAKSVQDHIDEVPIWADGTHLLSAPMTEMQWLIWSLAAA